VFAIRGLRGSIGGALEALLENFALRYGAAAVGLDLCAEVPL
jgi:hypothetical protein